MINLYYYSYKLVIQMLAIQIPTVLTEQYKQNSYYHAKLTY